MRSIIVAVVVAWAVPASAQIGFQTGTVQGTVLTNSGAVPALAFVRATATNGPGGGAGTMVSATGSYSMDLPTGSYHLDVLYQTAIVASADITLDTTGVTQDFRFAAGTLHVRVTRNAAPDTGAPVSVQLAPSCAPTDPTCKPPFMFYGAQTDANGDATLLVPVGSYIGGIGSSPIDPMHQSGSIIIGTFGPTSVTDGVATELGEYDYTTGTLTGQVTVGGVPAASATVRADGASGGEISTFMSDGTGTYAMTLPVQTTYKVSAYLDGSSLIGSVTGVTVDPAASTVLDFNQPGGYLTGHVLGDGAPAAGAQVFIGEQAPTCAQADQCILNDGNGNCQCELGGRLYKCVGNACMWFDGAVFSVSTDASGAFSKFVPPGNWGIGIAAVRPDPFQLGMIIVGSATAAVTSGTIDLGTFSYTTGTVSGSFTSCTQPLAGVTVFANSSRGSAQTSVQSTGYTLRVPVDTYTLIARLGSTTIAQQTSTVSASPTTFSATHDLGSLRGEILRNGLPATFTQVQVFQAPVGLSCGDPTCFTFGDFCKCAGASGPYECQVSTGNCAYMNGFQYGSSTGSDGFFTIPNIEPGPYTVVALSSGIVVGTEFVQVLACQQVEVGSSTAPVTAGTNETVALGDGIALTFDSVASGTATLAASSTAPPNAPIPTQFESAGLYYDISVPSFTGSVTVCLPYDADAVAAGADLHLYHDDHTLGWVDITTSIDTVNHIVCGTTSSFSVFTVLASKQAPLGLTAPASVSADASCTGHAALAATGGNGTYHWFAGATDLGTGASIDAALPLGTTTVRVVSGSASASATVTVIDTTPPTLSVSVSPATLWPPDGKMVAIASTPSVHDNCDASPAVTVLDATSPTAAPADISVSPLAVRAFRAGTETAGRTYTVHYAATDASGNRVTGAAAVTVPHDQR